MILPLTVRPISISLSLESLSLESLLERARLAPFPPPSPSALPFVFFPPFFEDDEEEEEEEEEEEADRRAIDLPPFLLEEVAAVAEEEEEEEEEEEDKEEREEEEEKEKSMSVFGWDFFVCIARAEDTFETAVSWSCSVVRSCDTFTAASQSAVCASSFMLFDFFSFFGGMLPKRQRIAQT